MEYRLARELQELLGYTQWRNFEQVIDKAKTACEKAGQTVTDHFADVSKMLDLVKGAQREVDDIGNCTGCLGGYRGLRTEEPV